MQNFFVYILLINIIELVKKTFTIVQQCNYSKSKTETIAQFDVKNSIDKRILLQFK